MPRATTPSFILEIPLIAGTAEARMLSVRFNAARQLQNAALGEALRRLDLMRERKAYAAACALPKTLGIDARTGKPRRNPARTAAFHTLRIQFGFSEPEIEAFANQCRKSCWIGDHVGSADGQTLADRAFRAVNNYALGKRGRPKFKRAGELESVEAKKNDACICWIDRDKKGEVVRAVVWGDLILPAKINWNDDYVREALKARTKYVRIVLRPTLQGPTWAAQLVQEGTAPVKKNHVLGSGVAAGDLGPSLFAIVSETEATLEQFCPGIEEDAAEIRRIQRAMDRSRRATNPENYNANGTVKKGSKRWRKSVRYRALQSRRAAAER
jgi:hypothetical protein